MDGAENRVCVSRHQIGDVVRVEIVEFQRVRIRERPLSRKLAQFTCFGRDGLITVPLASSQSSKVAVNVRLQQEHKRSEDDPTEQKLSHKTAVDADC